MTHAIGYVRVSTSEQAESGLGLEAQEAVIRAECDRRGWSVEIVADRVASGKQVNPELRRALDLLDAGQADALVIGKLDRLARSTRPRPSMTPSRRAGRSSSPTARSTSAPRAAGRWRTCSPRSPSGSGT